MNPPIDLRTEYVNNPIGLDDRAPRFSWKMNDPSRGAKQSAFQLVVHSSNEETPLWDTGKVATSQSTQIEYAGAPLASRMNCKWTVRTWNAAGDESPWSEPATFEIGLLHRTDWSAKWIGSSVVGGSYSIPPAPYLRKSFELRSEVQSARLYVTALGMYEFEINGQRVGDAWMAPGRTDYENRVPYHVFDVTSLLRSRQNVCGAILGDGWYCGHLHSDPRQTYGDRPRLLAQLEIEFSDGSKQIIATDETWRAGEGPIRSSDMLMGEDYDGRLDIPGWSAPGFDDSNWQQAIELPVDPKMEIVAHRAPPIRKQREIKPIKPCVTSANKRRHVFDLGQNMVGVVRLRVRGAKKGQVIDLRHAEMLNDKGQPYMTALRSARATDHYTCRGDEVEYFTPRFTFHGFRYVEVRDYPGMPQIDDITGIVLHSDAPPSGEFECSDPMLNQLQSNIVWSQRGNFLDIPTDCPQRDERLGWTGDAQVFIRTAAFNMDVANFFSKWLQDVADSQYPDGKIPSVVPEVKTLHNEGGPAWSDACVICPWTLYLCYADTRILEKSWPTMTRFMDFLSNTCPKLIRADETNKWRGYGDWLSMNAETSPDLIGTAFYAHCAKLMSSIALLLGKQHDAAHFATLHEQIRTAWQKRFVTPDGLIVGQTQTACVLALHFDLLPHELRSRVEDALVRDIRSRGMHLSTGFVGTPYLNHVLSRAKRDDVAYALLLQKTNPSWLFPITHGATTMWERWDGWTPEKGFNDAGMNSYNHYAFGAIGDWMYSTIAGIDLDPNSPGYSHILFHPKPGGGLIWAWATLDGPYGKIESSWKLDGDMCELKITVPANSSATIQIPAAMGASISEGDRPIAESANIRAVDGAHATFRLESGRYQFQFKATALGAAVADAKKSLF